MSESEIHLIQLRLIAQGEMLKIVTHEDVQATQLVVLAQIQRYQVLCSINMQLLQERIGREIQLLKKYRSLKSDIKDLKDSLVINPFQGTSLGKGVRKVRMAIASKGKGKSGGARVITYNLYQEGDTIIIDLLTIYDKGEISNISDEFISFLLDKRENG